MKAATVIEVVIIVFLLGIGFIISGIMVNIAPEIIPNVNTSVTYNNIDTFEDDTNNTDPNGNSSAGDYNPFYTYDEIGWDGGDGGYDNVTNLTDYQFDGNNGMWYYGNATMAGGTYTLLGENGNELCGRTDIDTVTWAMNFEYNTFNWDDANVSLGTDVSLYDCDLGLIVWLIVNETNASLWTTGPTMLMEIAITNMTFYRVEVTIDYTVSGSPEVSSSFWSLDLGGLFTVEADSNVTNIDCSKLWFVLYTPQRAGYWSNMVFDDFQFEFTVQGLGDDVADQIGNWQNDMVLVASVIIFAIILAILFLTIGKLRKK